MLLPVPSSPPQTTTCLDVATTTAPSRLPSGVCEIVHRSQAGLDLANLFGGVARTGPTTDPKTTIARTQTVDGRVRRSFNEVQRMLNRIQNRILGQRKGKERFRENFAPNLITGS